MRSKLASTRARQAARRKPVVLTIAGSDNSAGAGAQADLKTFSYFGCYGLTAITCVVAEVPGKVAAIQAIRPEIVVEQIALSFTAFPVAAAKTGMLHSVSIVEAVAEVFAARKTKLVVDPVMVASSGDPLLNKSAIAAYQKVLFPHATLVTPNLDELKILAGRDIRNLNEMRDAGGLLVEKYGCAFLLKGDTCAGRLLWIFWSPQRDSRSLPRLLWWVSKPTEQAARIRRQWPLILRSGLRLRKRCAPRNSMSREQSKNRCAGKRPTLSNISPASEFLICGK